MFMRFLGIGIGHCGQHPTEANIAASDGNSQTCTMDNDDESDGDTAVEDNDTLAQDDEDEGTDLEEYDDGDSDWYSDDDFRYDNL